MPCACYCDWPQDEKPTDGRGDGQPYFAIRAGRRRAAMNGQKQTLADSADRSLERQRYSNFGRCLIAGRQRSSIFLKGVGFLHLTTAIPDLFRCHLVPLLMAFA
jgi:hypothetical protein